VGERNEEIWKVRISPTTGKSIKPPSLVVEGLRAGKNLSLAQDGKLLLYALENQYSNIWLTSVADPGNAESVKADRLTSGTSFDSCPTISPDGQRVTFSRGYGKSHNIYVVPIEGGNPEQVTFLDSFNFYPSWSPDGREIAFISAQGGKAKVWTVSARGGSLHQFQNTIASANSYQLSWAPGRNILYQVAGNKNFHALNPTTGEEMPLIIDETVSSVHTAHISPDGKKVAAYVERIGQPSGVSIFDLEDGSLTDLYEGVFDPIGWTPDSEWIYVSDYKAIDVRVLKISLKDGKPEIIFSLSPSPLRGKPTPFQVRMSSDAKYFVFPANKSQSDVWMIENFDPDIEKN
jgi:Tol biopolymer transport system component